MNLHQYIQTLDTRFKSGISREHSYRADLEGLLRELVMGVEITNEPANVTECGNPDYVITKGKIPVGYIEAKDLGKDLNSKNYKEQFTRYRKALDNLIITDYLWFQFFQDGELVHEIRIGEIQGNSVKPLTENFDEFQNLVQNFCTYIGQTIKSAKRLAEMMAAKARLLENTLERAVTSDEENQENTSLKGQYEAFRQILIHDLTPKDFADIYSQTLAYGMFAARLHDPSLNNFSRQEAAELIPKTNPFLRKLFQYVAGYDIDPRIKTTVDNLADVFRATNVEALLHNFGKSTQTSDPIIHFYETFLAEYDPKLRKSRGVWYTPEPVVNFIVRAVDDILKTEFNLPQGLADTSKTKIKVQDYTKATADRRSKTKLVEREKEVHKVQILDPATGTGTFLAEVVKHIYKNNFKAMQGAWSGYVEEHLIPRLNGFELLMASYSMAHLKLDMLLRETGYKSQKDQRFNIFLTNSLEEHHPDTGTLFANWLSSEANEANHIKRDTPVMVVIGNPPYSVSSTNKSEWIQTLIADYKKNLNERKINLDDDYIKFIRYGQHFIDKNGSGVLAYISNNSFIDGITHRQMRKNLLESFDKIYIIDLHGNTKKKEVCPDGSLDQNVFDIMQGVSINLFVKTGNKKNHELGEVFHYNLWGKREMKYEHLMQLSINTIAFEKLALNNPYYFFVKKNFDLKDTYDKGINLCELFPLYSVGIETQRDSISIQFEKSSIDNIVYDFRNLSIDEIRAKYKIEKDGRDWQIGTAKNDITSQGNLGKLFYRPFDIRMTYYTGKSKGFMAYPRSEIMNHLFEKNNLSLIICKQQSSFDFQHIFISNLISDGNSISLQTKERASVFPLYCYFETSAQQTIKLNSSRTPNLNLEIVKEIAQRIGLGFVPEKEVAGNVCFINNQEVRDDYKTTFAPIDLLDYIYAVLHSPTYRETYKEFLKIDFPRVPYPEDSETFWKLVKLGGEIRQIHLLESPTVNQYITQYPVDGTNIVDKIRFEIYDYSNEIPDEKGEITYPDYLGSVYLNDTQYFADVPSSAWNFYIGGYQPAQKWLKDRKGRKLEYEDILHYQKIIVALTETGRIMKEIDKVIVESEKLAHI